MSEVTLVIPGKDCAATLDACLRSVMPLKHSGAVAEVIFVNDGSSDGSGEIAAQLGATVLDGPGLGAGRARNIGWRAATTSLIWFIDSDCVADPGALDLLLPHLDEPEVGGVGGSYANMLPDSLLASLIHAEIVQRHREMNAEVNFLATFNVLYRRSVLAQIGGFDERFIKAQDAELAYRARRAGHRLRFEPRSLVAHFHADTLKRYLKVQRQQGYWRAWLYAVHPQRIGGDSYSNWADHIQPPLALAMVALSPTLLMGPLAAVELPLAFALLVAQWPMTARLVKRNRSLRYAAFAPMSFCRAFSRGIGFAHGSAEAMLAKARGEVTPGPAG